MCIHTHKIFYHVDARDQNQIIRLWQQGTLLFPAPLLLFSGYPLCAEDWIICEKAGLFPHRSHWLSCQP